MKVRKRMVSDALRGWRELNKAINKFSEDEVIFALECENESALPRATVLRRLTQRYNGIKIEQFRKEVSK